MTGSDRSADYWLGDWRVRVDRHELSRGDEVRRVQPRLIAVLGCLVRAEGRTVSRDELLATVWQRRMVNDEVLSRAIADLRRALDDDARQAALIETVPKLGYRLCVPVRPVEEVIETSVDDGEASAPDGARVSSPGTRSLGWSRRSRMLVLASSLLVLVLVLVWWRWPAQSFEVAPPLLAPGDLVHARPLAGHADLNLTPRFSRRGDLYAFSSVAAEGDGARIQIRSRDGRVNATVGNDGEWDLCPLFSSDGGDLIWTRHDPGRCRLMRVAIAGGVQQELGRCATPLQSCPDLSADGERLLYSADGWNGLAELHLPTAAVREVTRLDAGAITDADPRYGPDGCYIAFLRGRSSDRELMLLDVASAQARRIELPLARIYGLTWLDPRHVVLATDSEGTRALVSVAIDDGRRVLLGAPGARRPDRADDGALIWEVANYQAHLWQLDADGGETMLTRHRRSDGHPVLSPDGRRVAFQSNREGPDAVWLLDLDTGEQQRLPLPSDTLWLYPAWLPHSDGLLLIGQSGGVSAAWRFRMDAAAPELIDAIPANAHEIQIAADGALWFLHDGDGPRRLWRLPAGSRTAELIVDGAVAAFRPHRDGIYFQRPESDALWRCDTDASACRDAGMRLGSSLPGTWALSDAALFHQRPQPDGGVRIMRRWLKEGAIDETMPWSMPSLLPRGLAVTPDGATAYVARALLRDVELAWLPPPERPLR